MSSQDSSRSDPAMEHGPATAEGTTLVTRRSPAVRTQRLRLYAHGREWIVDDAHPRLTFGRAETNTVAIGDEFASREHGSVTYGDGQVRVTDRSTNGTLIVRGSSHNFYLNQETLVLFGDGEIRLGRLEGIAMRFTVETLGADGALWQPTWPGETESELATPEGNILRREGEFWTLAYEGTVLRMKDAKALHYLAHLVRHPGQEIPAVDLVQVAGGGRPDTTSTVTLGDAATYDQPDAGAPLDSAAKAAYKRRLADLREEASDAERQNDLGQAERAREEIGFLEREISAAVGLGGRDRPVASHVERARVGVTVPLKALLKKLQGCHPALGHHLSTTVRTGRLCSYNPDPAHPPRWIL